MNQQYVVVVPKSLTWDKLSALFVHVVGLLQTGLENVRIRFEDEFPVGQIPTELVDIDVRLPYNRELDPQTGQKLYGSATERIAKLNDLLGTPGMINLVGMLAKNNATGNLKDTPRSYVALIRQMYEVGRNVDFATHRHQIVELFWPVVETYFTASAHNQAAIDGLPNPFSDAGYQSMAEIAGVDISAHLADLNRAFEKAAVRKDQTVDRSASVEGRQFVIKGHNSSAHFLGLLVETDDSRMASQIFRDRDDAKLVVTRKRDGHYAILVRGRQDLRALSAALNQMEPNLWFLDERPMERGGSPLLLNGSTSRSAVASALKPTELMGYIQEKFCYRTRKQQVGITQ